MSRERIKADLAIIGAGAAGLVTASGAAQLGRKVVLFEAGEMGGDCLNYGCVPSKAILTAAHKVHAIREASKHGIHVGEPSVDFARVRETIQQAITTIEPNDSQERFEGFGVRVVREYARFVSEDTVASDSVEVKAKRIVVATGTRAFIPPVEGLAGAPYLTNETIWSLEALPGHLIVMGGGPIGMELGQAFRRLGSKVTIIEAGEPLSRFESEHAALVTDQLMADGVILHTGKSAARVQTDDAGITVALSDGDVVSGSHLLVATGRKPVLDGLDLDVAGVETDARGIVCDDRLRTSNKRVLAAGDIAGKGGLTHLAGWHGSVIVRNLYYGLSTGQSSQPIPAAVYTDPPIAQIGLTEAQARDAHGDKVKVASWGFDDNDRAIAEGDVRGGVKLVLGKGGKVLGAHAAGARADDLIQIVSSVMAKGGTVRDLTSPVAPYPTRGEIFKRAAGSYYEPVVFGSMAKLLARILSAFH
ncbi:NAD(P)/FAD-dependent oxidoreductase [Oceanicaulis sp. MMSF_3324]|uniref:dihydrolipoyl dehydrogenase family protein n=1 Tax=Oceanicaulis sp. MMSF_3324 TaxID=3046702 RepID=UPI00273FAC73|nr:FAD-dependent oxidoreductase [Oceanicaulis sp. MMSF_3324]